MKRQDTRDKLVQVGAEIIAQQGFNSTGINTVLSTAGVPKGSFYYYFSSKEDFGLAVIESFVEAYDAKLEAILGDTTSAPLERLRNYFRAGMADMASSECSKGCLIGNLGQELSAQSDVFRARLDQVFRGWERRLGECLAAARNAGEIAADQDVDELASFILAGWEGAILRAKMVKSTQPMQGFIDIFFGRVLAVA